MNGAGKPFSGFSVDDVEVLRYGGFRQDDAGVMRGQGPDIAWFMDPAGYVLSVLSQD